MKAFLATAALACILPGLAFAGDDIKVGSPGVLNEHQAVNVWSIESGGGVTPHESEPCLLLRGSMVTAVGVDGEYVLVEYIGGRIGGPDADILCSIDAYFLTTKTAYRRMTASREGMAAIKTEESAVVAHILSERADRASNE